MAAKIKGLARVTFNDAGTGKSYVKGKDHLFEAGAHANYLAAGLISAAPAKAAKTDEAPEDMSSAITEV